MLNTGCNGPFSLSATRPDTSAASGTSSFLRERGDFNLISFLSSAFYNFLPEMTILENACVEIKKEKKKKATTTIKSPPIYHCNISWVAE